MTSVAEAIEQHPMLSAEERKILARNERFRGIYAGRRAFVVGNGPSLNKIPLERLKCELVFAVNGFASHEILDTWQPIALALTDPVYFERPDTFAAEFARTRTRLKDCSFFVPLAYRRAVERYSLLPLNRCFYSHMSGSMARQRIFPVDLTGPVPNSQTVTLFAILLSLYMGCNPIYLVGMDHDFLATPKNPTHFSSAYESDLSENDKTKIGFQNWTYLQLIDAVKLMFEGYANLKNVATKRRQIIYNASVGGYLDVFPRVTFDDIFKSNESR